MVPWLWGSKTASRSSASGQAAAADAVGPSEPERSARYRRAPGSVRWLEREQLDVEHEHASRLVCAAAVGELLGDPESTLLAGRHQLHAFRPPLDDFVESERNRLFTRGIEHTPVRVPSRVQNGD